MTGDEADRLITFDRVSHFSLEPMGPFFRDEPYVPLDTINVILQKLDRVVPVVRFVVFGPIVGHDRFAIRVEVQTTE